MSRSEAGTVSTFSALPYIVSASASMLMPEDGPGSVKIW